jgi:glyoxylase-like metal-dependent hydrolase (beta-lactamase superfamily II)
MKLRAFFDPETFTLTYVVWDEASREAAVIDPVLDYDPLDVRVHTATLDALTAFLDGEGLKPRWVLETHAHADHISGAQHLKARYDARVAIGARITTVQSTFKDVFDLGEDFATDGRQFDRLLSEGEGVELGGLSIGVLHTPGHTPACISYTAGDAVFTGDALFMPDFGTGRCDFPAGSAADLYDSITKKLYTLPDSTRVLVGHDYQPGGRALAWETTIGASKRDNIQLKAETSREDFVRFRTDRDKTLRPPKLIFPSVQVNVDAGRLPAPAANGRRYLKLPLGLFGA